MTIGSRFGTNVHPVTVCLTAHLSSLDGSVSAYRGGDGLGFDSGVGA